MKRRTLAVTVSSLLAVAGIAIATPKRVSVVSVTRGRAVNAVYATGTVEAEDRIGVKAKVPGSVIELLVREGDKVERGALLARVQNTTITHALERGKLELASASKQAAPKLSSLVAKATALRAELALARSEADRADSLVKGGGMSALDRDRLKSHATRLDAELRSNFADQELARIALTANTAQVAEDVKALTSQADDTEVRAPIAGVVLRRHVELSEVVMQNQVLFDVGNTAQLALRVAIDEGDVARVKIGSHALVTMYAFRGETFRAKVTRIFPDADRATKSFPSWLHFEGTPPNLKSGMTVEANIVTDERDNALIVPSETLDSGSVWRVEGFRARKVTVDVGLRDLVRAEVKSGVRDGDQLLVARDATINDGSWVWPRKAQ